MSRCRCHCRCSLSHSLRLCWVDCAPRRVWLGFSLSAPALVPWRLVCVFVCHFPLHFPSNDMHLGCFLGEPVPLAFGRGHGRRNVFNISPYYCNMMIQT